MIKTTLNAGILQVVLNRPEKKNALTCAMYLKLTEVFEQANLDSQIKVVVITGEGAAFSAGNDLDDFLANPPTGPDSPAFAFMQALAKLDKPLIAAVNGFGVGIGATLLLHCDLAYAAPTARFIFPFVSLGLVPEAGSTLLLARQIGVLRANELLLLGDPLSAQEAEQLGLINRVVSDQPVVDFAMQQAEKLARLPVGAIRETRRLIRPWLVETTEKTDVLERIRQEAVVFAQRVTSAAAREAVAAFNEKRKPDFSALD